MQKSIILLLLFYVLPGCTRISEQRNKRVEMLTRIPEKDTKEMNQLLRKLTPEDSLETVLETSFPGVIVAAKVRTRRAIVYFTRDNKQQWQIVHYFTYNVQFAD